MIYEPMLHVAVLEKRIDIAKSLIRCGEDVNLRNMYGCSAFHVAIVCSTPEFIRFMIQRGADLNAMAACGSGCEQFTPLYLTFRFNLLHIMKILINCGADVMNVFKNQSLWDLAMSSSKNDVIKLLIECFHSSETCREAGVAYFFRAIEKNNFEAIYTLQRYKFPMRITDSNGVTGLHRAVKMGQLESIKVLLIYDVGIIVRDILYDTPLSMASNTNPKLVNYLEKCLHEIKEMKKEFILEDVSYYDVLRRNDAYIASFVKTEEFEDAMKAKEYAKKFIKFGSHLTRKFIKVRETRMKLHAMEDNIFDLSLHCNIPFEVSEQILSYLDQNDLLNLRKAFEYETLILIDSLPKPKEVIDSNGQRNPIITKLWNFLGKMLGKQ